MNLNEVKNTLIELEEISFVLPNGELVPRHFHVTEVGLVTKHFIDCGGTLRSEEVINFQLWNANDYDHRIHPEKLLSIIELSEKTLGFKNLEIEVEYQGDTIGKYGLDFNGSEFLLTYKQTDCLAKDQCGTSTVSSIPKSVSICDPATGCC